MNNIENSIHDSVFRIGIVCSVDGREVKVRVDRNKNSTHLFYKGELIKNVSVGSYVKILKGYVPLIGKVESETLFENKVEDKKLISPEDLFSRILVVKLIGYISNHKFNHGVNELPLIDNECHLLTNNEFNLIHTFGSSNDNLIRIGHLASDSLVPISFGIGKLFSSHIGIFGNTGSGKSYTLSKLYHELFVHFEGNSSFKENSHFLFFDFNGEYSSESTISLNKKVYKLTTRHDHGNKIPFNEDDLLDINLLSIFSNATEKTQRPFISRCIKLYKDVIYDVDKFRNYLRDQVKSIFTISDGPKSVLLIDYVESILRPCIQNENELLDLRNDITLNNKYQYFYKGNTTNDLQSSPELIETLNIYKAVDSFNFSGNFISNFIAVMYMRLIYDVLDNRAMNEHIAPAINKLRQAEDDINRIFDTTNSDKTFWDNSNIVVIDLSDVNIDTKKRIPLLITNKLYTEHKDYGKATKYLNVIIDEAHNILSYQSMRESEDWKDYRLEVFEEIIKEGRKFGVFMTIASQRPSDISSTIISQLHNYFIHRLVNEKDIEQVNNTISYLDKVSVESLPILSTGVCVVAGVLAEMPIVMQVERIAEGFEPQNETIDIESLWNQ